MLTIQEAADALGFSPKTLYAAARDGRLAAEVSSIGLLVPQTEIDRLTGHHTLGSRKAARARQRVARMKAGRES